MTSHQLITTELFLRIWNLTSLAHKITTTKMYTFLENNQHKGRGGYSGGGRGSLVHKSCTKRILYQVVAMAVVEQDMTVVENLSWWSF
ncbi:hypothetical protein GOBAR_AA07725 [Gossypium barbadense]|uniref:Uncharacterized protein n=1 Tax=Gossypium barbadense TaxID=3634 RepID=A0A2P5YBF4_GOSBA|nr:hypothetical protein GOBAR_AA07725 [Gossypium barbadense]